MSRPKRSKLPNYKKPFTGTRSARAGKQFETRKRFPTGTNRLIAAIIRRAKEKTGWTWPQLAYYLRIGQSESTINCRAPGILKDADMTRIRYDKYIALARLAGIPRPVAAVIYAKSCIPDEFPIDRQAVGLAMRNLLASHFMGETEEDQRDALELVKDFVPASARDIPDATRAAGMRQIYSGMPLPRQTRDMTKKRVEKPDLGCN